MNIAIRNKGKIFSLSLAHMVNDWYMNYIQTLLPYIVAAGISISKGAFLISIFTITSSLLQPVFGYLIDKRNKHWLCYIGTIWMAVLLSMIGLFRSYIALVLVVALAGLGTAAFHPQASAMTAACSGERKGLFQAVFIAAGNVGWAFTPLIAVPIVEHYGLRITPVFALPGIAITVLLFYVVPKIQPASKPAPTPLLPALRSAWSQLLKVMLVVAFRSLTYFSMVSFLPMYLLQKKIPSIVSSRLVFIMLFSGALGGLLGGFLSDKFGRKIVIIVSLSAASPVFFLFLMTNGIISYIFLTLAGALLLASFSVTVVIAQNAISKNAAMASGLMLGAGTGIGGLGVGAMGILVENLGISFAVNLLIWFPLMAGLLGIGIKEKNSINIKTNKEVQKNEINGSC